LYDLDFTTHLTDDDSNWTVHPYQPDDGEDDMLTALASLGITTPQQLAALDAGNTEGPTTADASRGTPSGSTSRGTRPGCLETHPNGDTREFG